MVLVCHIMYATKHYRLYRSTKHNTQYSYIRTMYLICCSVPPEVALRTAHAASFLVLYSAAEFITSMRTGNRLQSITAWVRDRTINKDVHLQVVIVVVNGIHGE